MREPTHARRLADLRAELVAAWTGPTFDPDRAAQAMQELREELKAMGIKDSGNRRKPGRRRVLRRPGAEP